MHKILKIESVVDGIRFEMITQRANAIDIDHVATFGRGNLQFGMMMQALRIIDLFSADEFEADITKEDAETIIKKHDRFTAPMTDAQATVIELVRQSLVQSE